LIDGVKISKFRGISGTILDGLGKTNIFVGKNNSGKSSVLESLYFARAAFNPVNQLGEPVLKHLLQRRINRVNLDPREFFLDYGRQGNIAIELRVNGRIIPLQTQYFPDNRSLQYQLKYPGSDRIVATYDLGANSSAGTFVSPLIGSIGSSIGFRELERAVGQGSPNQELARMQDFVASTRDTYGFISAITLIDAEFVREIGTIESKYWGKILEDRSDKSLRETLNEV